MIKEEAAKIFQGQLISAGSTAASLAAFGRDSTEHTHNLKLVQAKIDKLEQRLQDHREYLAYHETTHEWAIAKVSVCVCVCVCCCKYKK